MSGNGRDETWISRTKGCAGVYIIMKKTMFLILSSLLAFAGALLQADEADRQAEEVAAAKNAVETYLAETPPIQYPELQRNGLFPFAVVSRVDANLALGKYFGCDFDDSLRGDLIDMLRHNLNAWYNFCDGTDWRERLTRCEDVGMRLIETRYCSFGFPPFETQDTIDFVEASKSPALLAWYGPDEPPMARIPWFLANKRRVYELDPKHPYASAVVNAGAQKMLAPAMEAMLANFYYGIGTENDPEPFLKHFDDVRYLRSITRGKRVWLMTQTFSNRHQNEFNQEPVPYKVMVARYPTPLEIRLDMNCIAAGGAAGISFFIYNGIIPYWGEYEVENFDYTLVDPWGNGNATYDEIAAFGDKIVPVMPSIMDAEPSESIKVDYDNEALLLGQSENALGMYLYFVNKSLEKAYEGCPAVNLPEGCGLYDLVALERKDDCSIELIPGDGIVLAICTPENFAILKSEITGRREEKKALLESIRVKELARAGFSDGIASAEWLEAEKALEQIRREFGAIHQMLAPANVIARAYNAPELEPHKVRLCVLSRQFFAMKRNLAEGKIPDAAALADLCKAVKILAADYSSSSIVVTYGR